MRTANGFGEWSDGYRAGLGPADFYICDKPPMQGEVSSHPQNGRSMSLGNLRALDLSPLGKFMQAGRDDRPDFVAMARIPAGSMLYQGRDEIWVLEPGGGHKPFSAYGWPVFEDLTPPTPEKSPIDREIDKMMERRKAKRDRFNSGPGETDDAWVKKVDGEIAEHDRAEALDRALSKASFHSLTIVERLSAYRGPEL